MLALHINERIELTRPELDMYTFTWPTFLYDETKRHNAKGANNSLVLIDDHVCRVVL
jgi:hypothetical protein